MIRIYILIRKMGTINYFTVEVVVVPYTAAHKLDHDNELV